VDDIEIRVTWKGKKAKMVLQEEDDEVKGYIEGRTHVLTFELDDTGAEPEVEETFHHKDLECDSDAVQKTILEALDEDDEDDEDDSDDEDEDEDEDDEDDEEDEDEDEDEAPPKKT
jgi:hypothetical protein